MLKAKNESSLQKLWKKATKENNKRELELNNNKTETVISLQQHENNDTSKLSYLKHIMADGKSNHEYQR